MFASGTLKMSMILRAEPVTQNSFKKYKAKETSISNVLELSIRKRKTRFNVKRYIFLSLFQVFLSN